jgi:prepilin-type N-terminal cleavage/methylation domain-containing protein
VPHPSCTRRPRSGMTLIEVLVALLIVASMTAGVAALVSVNVIITTRASAADDEMRKASAFLDLIALWPSEDLERHLGEHEQGPWRLRVLHPAATLYTVTVLDSTGRRILLSTAVYRSGAEPRREEHER